MKRASLNWYAPMCGVIGGLGIVLPQAFKAFDQGVHEAPEELPGCCNRVIGDLMNALSHIQDHIAQSERQIQLLAKEDRQAQHLMQLRGIGPAAASASPPASAMGMT